MAAMMTATVLPASAVSVLADNTASVTIDADATNNPTEDQLKTALDAIKGNASSTYGTSVRTTASTLEGYIKAALEAANAGKTYSVTVTSLSTSKAPTYAKVSGSAAVVYGTLSGIVQVKEGSASASSEYNFTLDANTLDDQDKAAVAAAAAKYDIENAVPNFAATGTVLANDVKVLTSNALTKAGIASNGSVSVTISSQTESTKTEAGTVAGTVTVTYEANAGAANEKTYTATADYSAKRAAAAHSLTSGLATNVANDLGNALFANDVTAEKIANYIESLKHNADIIGSGSTLADDGISAEVSNVTIKKAATHGKAGSAIVVFTLTEDGSDPQIKTATIALRQSDDDIFAEAEANITASAKAIDETNAKKEGKTTYTSVSEDDALTNAKKVLTDAWAAKVGTADDAVALSEDAYPGKSPAAGLAELMAADKTAFKKFSFTAPTIDKEGKLTATYTLVIADGDKTDGTASSNTTKDVTFTLTYPKLSKKAATKIELGNAQTLAKSATLDLNTKVTPAGANDVTWTSSNPDVATIDASGILTAKAAGTTTVTATSSTNNLSDSVVITVTNATLPFVDVQDTGKYYYSPILDAYTKKLTVGITPTEFGVNETVKRGQFVFWLYKVFGDDITGYADPGFTDVSSTAYYADAVAWAKAKGITGGTTATTFSPDADVTRAQAVTMLYKARGSEKATVTKQFSDVPVNKWYTDAVNWAYTKGVTAGTSDTTFSPDQVCTRAQAMTFIMTR